MCLWGASCARAREALRARPLYTNPQPGGPQHEDHSDMKELIVEVRKEIQDIKMKISNIKPETNLEADLLIRPRRAPTPTPAASTEEIGYDTAATESQNHNVSIASVEEFMTDISESSESKPVSHLNCLLPTIQQPLLKH